LLSEQALALGRQLNDHRAEAKALWNLMLVALLAEDDRQTALTYGEQALELARTHNLREELAYTLHDLASVYAGVGRAQDAWAAGEEAGDLWRELGNQPMLVDNRANAAWGRYHLGNMDEAVALADEALQVSRSIGSLWGETYSLFTLAPLYLEKCDYGRAMGAIQEGIPLAQQANFEIAHVLASALGGVYGFLGDLDRSVQMLRKVVSTSEKREDRLLALTILAYVALHHRRPGLAGAAINAAGEQFSGDATHPFLSISRMMTPVIKTEMALSQGAYERVLTLSAEGARAAFQLGAPASNQHTVSADLLRLRGHALMSLGRTDEAHAVLNHARTEAASRDSDRMSWMFLYILWQRRTMWKTLTALSEIEAGRGNQTEAIALRAQARDYVIAVAEKIAQADLRSAFLGLREVRDVVSEA
jgi:tetratricopeptide (TPR) repeat protein